jgi:formylglycine-generating enzyme required for sulfatase activity
MSARRALLLLAGAALLLLTARRAPAAPGLCPDEMASISGKFCIDRHEASVEELDRDGKVTRLHPHNREIGGRRVRAVSRPGVLPQAYLDRNEAQAACEQAGKRLCTGDEWLAACRGRTPSLYPYGPRFRSGHCNDEGVSPLQLLHGPAPGHDFATMNDPRLDEIAGGVARTGAFARCTAGDGVLDMVGNLHEWTAASRGPAEAPRAVFRGGYFLDTHTLGEGCSYVTEGHLPTYRDYSIGFRCCADLPGAPLADLPP